MKYTTAEQLWSRLDSLKTTVMRRAEQHAKYTVPELMLESGQNTDDGDGGRLWQSVGAQLVNNLSTRLMLALFAPSRPFVRLDPADEYAAAAKEAGVTEDILRQILSQGEKKIVKTLDNLALRPKLYELLKHLIVIGNVLAIMDRDERVLRVMSLRHFCVKRDVAGRLHTLVIKEQVALDELPEEAQALAVGVKDDDKADYYIIVERDYAKNKFKVTEWIGDIMIPGESFYTEDECPYRVLTWSLADEANYGTSLVGSYEGDFAAVEKASASLIVAAVLASEFRWLVNVASGTRVEDWENSSNGAFIPGVKDGVILVNAAGEVAQAMQAQMLVIKEYVNRLGRGFIMTSAVTRDAERVTAEEIRLLAGELENGLGGGYSRLAVDLQRPLGLFLMALNKFRVKDKEIELTVVTGLDALSRNGDLENLRGWLDDIMKLNAAGPEITRPLNLTALYRDLASPRGIDATEYLRDPEEIKAEQDEQAAREVAAAQASRAPQGEPQA